MQFPLFVWVFQMTTGKEKKTQLKLQNLSGEFRGKDLKTTFNSHFNLPRLQVYRVLLAKAEYFSDWIHVT